MQYSSASDDDDCIRPSKRFRSNENGPARWLAKPSSVTKKHSMSDAQRRALEAALHTVKEQVESKGKEAVVEEPEDDVLHSLPASTGPVIDPLDALLNQMSEAGPIKGSAPCSSCSSSSIAALPTPAGDSEDSDSGNHELSTSAPAVSRKELKPVDHSKIEYPPFRKDFGVTAREIARLTEDEVTAWRKSLGIQIHGKHCPRPIKSWYHAGIPQRVVDVLINSGFKDPFAIQSQAIPAILAGRDVIGIAETGSGKTLAFLVPLLRHVSDQPKRLTGEGPVALIMAPTRELAMQIFQDARPLCKTLHLDVACVYGGAAVAEQIAQLKHGADIVVCTPGRMIDMLCANRGRVTNLMRVTFVVLDEADRMFDMGFEPQITRILANIRPDRQCVMFSATFPRKIEALARKVLKSPVEIVVGKRASAAVSVEQHVEVLSDDNSKFRRLLQLLGVSQSLSVLVFVQRQDDADRLFSALLKHGYPSLALHGGMDQFDRDTTMADFRNGVCRVLVATSVAARGLHVDNLDLVVNYDPPDHYEDYIHRIGRTGRAGRPGSAFTFLTNEDDRFAVELVRALEQSGAAVPLGLRQLKERFDEKVARGEAAPVTRNHGFGGSGFKFNEEEQQKHKAQRQAERKVYLSGDEDEQDAEVSEDETAGERDASKDNLSKDALPPVTGPLPKGSGNKSNVTLHATDAKLEAAKAKAMQVVAAISQRSANSGSSGLVPTSMPGLPSASRGDRSTSTSVGEFEINDFPQVVRWRIVNKDAVSELQDRTGCAITPKGEFVNPKAKAQADQRKLYLLIEGPSPQHVEHCLEELRSIADRQMAKYAVQAERASARYKVV